MRQDNTYTRVDVIVTLLCLAAGLLCLGAAGRSGREMAKRAVCASNISQNLDALIAYAQDSDGRLPKQRLRLGWLNELDAVHAATLINQYDLQKEMLYCPSNEPQQRWMDVFYEFNTDSDIYGFRVTGYCYLLEAQFPINQNQSTGRDGEEEWVSSIAVETPSETPITIDATLSFGDDFATGLWFTSITNHLTVDETPRGGNEGYLDGHVSWSPFSDMEIRYQLNQGPAWWWYAPEKPPSENPEPPAPEPNEPIDTPGRRR